jgi:cysteinyl-tRNA synthetase
MIEVKSEKMSKSSGLKTDWILKNLLKKYSPDVIKIYILSTHYRSPLEFSGSKLEEAKKALERITNVLSNLDFLINSTPTIDKDKEKLAGKINSIISQLKKDFEAAMDDDFNSARAIGEIFDMVKDINTIIQDPDFNISEDLKGPLNEAYDLIIKLTAVLGLNLLPKAETSGDDISGQEIEAMIEKRNQARKERDFAEADRIRDELLSRGIVLEDRKEGTIWKVKD